MDWSYTERNFIIEERMESKKATGRFRAVMLDWMIIDGSSNLKELTQHLEH